MFFKDKRKGDFNQAFFNAYAEGEGLSIDEIMQDARRLSEKWTDEHFDFLLEYATEQKLGHGNSIYYGVPESRIEKYVQAGDNASGGYVSGDGSGGGFLGWLFGS